MRLKHIAMAVLMLPAILGTSCLDNGDDTIVLQSEKLEKGVEARVVSTDQSATIRNNGYVLRIPMNAVPKTNAGNTGKVAFSISPLDELPAHMPSGITYVNNTAIKMEPMGFVFDSPLTIQIPTKGNDPSELVLLRYNEYTGEWENVPFSVVDEEGNIEVSVIELGIFAVGKTQAALNYGGIRIKRSDLNRDYVYYLTVVSSNSNESKRISYADNGQDLYMSNLPLGTYTVNISRQRRNGLNNASSEGQYLSNISVRVQTKLIKGDGGYDSYSGWTLVSLSSQNWNSGRPEYWGEATTTYGTGAFQATLTWVNNSSSATDYDLHLTGPNTHVYFGAKRGVGFELDRDWLQQSGNAVENIYSISDDMPKGEYRVYVHHYSGATGKRFNCRVIINGVVVKSVTGQVTESTYDVHSFRIE